MRTTIDSAGRVVIPKEIRKTAGLSGSAEVEIDIDDDGVITIQPAPSKVRLVKRGRLLVAEFDESVPKIGVEEVNAITKALRERKIR